MGKGQEEERVKRYTAVEARENVNKTREVKKKRPFQNKRGCHCQSTCRGTGDIPRVTCNNGRDLIFRGINREHTVQAPLKKG